MTSLASTVVDAARSTGERWAGVARSDDPAVSSESFRALVAEATSGRTPTLLLVFTSPTIDLDALAAAVGAEVPPSVVVAGATTAGEIWSGGARGNGLVVMAIGGDGLVATSRLATGASADVRAAGAEVARALDDLGDVPNRVLMILADGLVGDLQELVRGAYDVAGAMVPLVGGCAGDDGHMRETFVISGGRVVTDAVVGVAVGSPAPFGIGIRHGWRRIGDAMLVTRSSGTRVLSIDDEPALDVYLRRLNAPEHVRTDPVAFTEFAMTHPIGMSRRSGEEVRFIAGADFEERSIQCIAQVPQGGVVWIMEGDDSSVLAATREACADAVEALDGAKPVAMLAFDCIARRGVLGDVGIGAEVELIGAAADGAAVAGFYTYGEIARTRGTGGFHNQTLVVLGLS